MMTSWKTFIVLLVVASAIAQRIDPGDTLSNCIPVRPAPRSCPRSAEFRTIDGTCNNVQSPVTGASFIPLRRFQEPVYADGFDTPRGFPGTQPTLPTANQVSRELFIVENTRRGNANLSVLFMTFGQFLDHDIALSPHPQCNIRDCRNLETAFRYPCFPILFQNGGPNCSPIARSEAVCPNTRRAKTVREQINVVTAFVDGSQIYGSEEELERRLRTNDGTGRLRVQRSREGGLLPIDSTIRNCEVFGGCSLVGDERGDENVALHSMHTLWVREHNRIATELRTINRRLSGERTYQLARKIVGGILQKIVFEEWLPRVARLPAYRRYNSTIDTGISNAFSTAAFRFGHSLIPNTFSQLNRNFDEIQRSITLREAFLNRDLVNRQGIEGTMFGLIGNTSNDIDNRFAFGIARRVLLRPGEERDADLLAYNIMRGRDHALPTYGQFRDFCGLPRIRTFSELGNILIPGTLERLQRLYSTPDDIDLFAAGISERTLRGLEVGPTFECLISKQFLDLRDGDRFYYLASDVFTVAQRTQIQRASMSRVLCDNLDGIVSIQRDAFRADGRRVSCSRISNVDLNEFV